MTLIRTTVAVELLSVDSLNDEIYDFLLDTGWEFSTSESTPYGVKGILHRKGHEQHSVGRQLAYSEGYLLKIGGRLSPNILNKEMLERIGITV